MDTSFKQATDHFIDNMLYLLSLEKKAHRRRMLAVERDYPSKLQIVSTAKPPLGGTLLTVEPVDGTKSALRVGSWVELKGPSINKKIKGVIISQRSQLVIVHTAKNYTGSKEEVAVREVAINSYDHFYQNLRNISTASLVSLQALLGQTVLSTQSMTMPLNYRDQDLSGSQRQAVSFAMAQPSVALIHGPPGESRLAHHLIFVYNITDIQSVKEDSASSCNVELILPNV